MAQLDKNPESVGERALLCLRQYVLREAAPGTHLKLGPLAERFVVGEMPVRIALNVMALEDIIEFRPRKGFFTKRPTGREFYGLYVHHNYLVKGCVSDAIDRPWTDARDAKAPQLSIFPAEDVDGHAPEQIATFAKTLFLRIGEFADSASVMTGIRAINDRLHRLRLAELHVLDDSAADLERLCNLLRLADYRELKQAADEYHTRRLDCLTDILKKAYGADFIDDAPDLWARASRDKVAYLVHDTSEKEAAD